MHYRLAPQPRQKEEFEILQLRNDIPDASQTSLPISAMDRHKCGLNTARGTYLHHK